MLDDLKNIATAYAEENCSDAVYPAHLFKAALHKDVGLVSFIETQLDKDYYYLMDWADVQCRMAPRAPRPVRGPELSAESEEVFREADSYKAKFGLDDVDAVCVLAALVTPGVGFSFDQLKTLPLAASDICEVMGAGADASKPAFVPTPGTAPAGAKGGKAIEKYCTDRIKEAREG